MLLSGLPLWPNNCLPPYTWLLPSNFPQSAWVRGGCCHSLLPRVQSQGLTPGSHGARSINWNMYPLETISCFGRICQTITQTLTSTTQNLHLCACHAEMHVGKSMLLLTTNNLNLVLVVDVGSCLQQSLNCLSVSLLGSYPQRNSTILMRERETVNCRVQHCQVSEEQTPQSVVSEDQGMRHDTNQYSDNTMSQNTDVQMEL